MQRVRALSMSLAVLLLVSGLVVSALARPRGPHHDRHDRHDRLTRLEQHLDGLNLDDTTRAAVQTSIDAAQTRQSQIRKQLREAYQGLRQLMQQDLPDETAVSAQMDTIGALTTEHRKQAALTWLAVLAQLTPEQRVSLRETMRPRGDWKQDRGQ